MKLAADEVMIDNPSRHNFNIAWVCSNAHDTSDVDLLYT